MPAMFAIFWKPKSSRDMHTITAHTAGDVLSRLSRLEATLGEQQQQLALVTAQQESLAKAVMGLVDKLAADSGAHDGVQRAEVQELAQQVCICLFVCAVLARRGTAT
jgi:hypothetical protein